MNKNKESKILHLKYFKNLFFQGEEYVSTSKKLIPAKTFNSVSSCCSKKCFERIDVGDQLNCFESFWKSAKDYKSQNFILSMLMTRNVQKENSERTLTRWNYMFHCNSENVMVCQKFLLNLLHLKIGRFTTIQKKLLNNESLEDNRGKHDSHQGLSNDLKQMIHDHCKLIPHSNSHYGSEKSNLLYFDNSELNISEMYKLFIAYYTAETGDIKPPITLSTYSKYFNHNLNFSFSKPRTDVCDFCFENRNNVESEEYRNHKQNVNDYNSLKEGLMSEEDVLSLEFDFGQNLQLPKIPVSEQFYKRLIWLHIFNVHTLGKDKRSYMYFFMEGELKKGGNTISNFLLDAIEREFTLNYYNKIYLFSDSCGGQNKNYLMMSFLSLLSQKFQIEIQHVFQVRGHSYCSCDRNFGMYGQKKKKNGGY